MVSDSKAWTVFAVGAMLAFPTGRSAPQCPIQELSPGGSAFGWSIDASAGTLAIGAIYDGDMTNGAVYVFERVEHQWVFAGKLEPGGDGYGGRFGESVSIHGDMLVVGASDENGVAAGEGAAYVYRRGLEAWRLEQRIKAGDPIFGDSFGWDVACDGARIVVGAPGGPFAQGRAFVFRFDGRHWNQEALLAPAGGQVGFSVAIENGTILLGSPYSDEVFSYVQTDTGWALQATLSGRGHFGYSIDLGTNVALVGSPDLAASFEPGWVTAFVKQGDGWEKVETLHAPDGARADNFGTRVALSSDQRSAVVGAFFEPGAAFAFGRDEGGWFFEEKLVPPVDPDSLDSYGMSVAIHGGERLVGDRFAQDGAVWSFSTAEGALSTTSEFASLSRQTSQGLVLETCPPRPGAPYRLAGSAAGTWPGVDLHGISIPLNAGSYLSHTLSFPNRPPLADSLGILDADGSAVAAFTLPSGGTSSLVGLVLHHAFVVGDVAGTELPCVSNAEPVKIVP